LRAPPEKGHHDFFSDVGVGSDDDIVGVGGSTISDDGVGVGVGSDDGVGVGVGSDDG
jgi:hypothetical protein